MLEGEAIILQSPKSWRRLCALSRTTSSDLSTETGRAQERHRRVLFTAAASGLAKLVSVGTALVSVPLTLHYLGNERYGMWMTISSLTVMLAFADFGIGNGVLNAVAKSSGEDSPDDIVRYISTAYIALTAIAAVIALVFCAAYPIFAWQKLFNVAGSLAVSEAGPAIYVFFLIFALSIPMSVIQRVQLGLQEGFIYAIWQCIGNLVSLVAVLSVIFLKGGLIWLVAAFTGIPSVISLANSFIFFGKSRPDLRPRWASFDRRCLRELSSSGLIFFVLQAAASVAYASNNIVIAQSLGAESVSQFAVPERLFSVITIVLSLAMAPLWPAYGEAMARGDRVWVIRTMWRSLALSLGLSGAFSLGMLFVGPVIIHAWVGPGINVSVGLLLALAIWKVMEAGGQSISMFLNGANLLMVQAVSGVLTAVAAIGLKIMWVGRIGVSGVVWGTIAAYAVCGIPLLVFAVRRVLLDANLRQ